ncbi:MAG: Lrp/AsnC family transcriptional regulator [Alphaproteobacteria bacterium]|nr:Lrp/AsnC family transcriptional regulator [Alphaproteobacteria bacterium]
MELDRTDREILTHLQNDARLMNKQLSAEVGLAPSSCHERVKRLWSRGVITGTTTLLDPKSVGFALCAVIFANVSKDGQINNDRLLDQLIAAPEIQNIDLVTGKYDMIISIVARDMDHLKSAVYEALTLNREIISFETSIVYDQRRDARLPID